MSYEDDLILRARELERLQRQRRKLRRQLRVTEVDIRHVKRVLKALRTASASARPQTAPNRLTGGVTGYEYAKPEPDDSMPPARAARRKVEER